MTPTQITLDGYPTDDPRRRGPADLGRTLNGVAARLGARGDGTGAGPDRR